MYYIDVYVQSLPPPSTALCTKPFKMNVTDCLQQREYCMWKEQNITGFQPLSWEGSEGKQDCTTDISSLYFLVLIIKTIWYVSIFIYQICIHILTKNKKWSTLHFYIICHEITYAHHVWYSTACVIITMMPKKCN